VLRLFVIGLFVLNLLILGWKLIQPDLPQSNSTRSVNRAVIEETGVPRILLLSERSESDNDSVVEDSGRQCFALGPFPSPNEFRVIETRLRETAVAISMRETEATVERGFWVFLPPEEDPQDLAVSVAVLEAGGLDDFAVIQRGPDTGSISLGLYSTEEYAELRRQKLEDMGLPFMFEVGQKIEEEKQYWMDYESLPGKNPTLEQLLEGAEGLNRLSLSCQEMAWHPEDTIERPLDSPLELPLEQMEIQTTVADPERRK
jgi:hypothetical protein